MEDEQRPGQVQPTANSSHPVEEIDEPQTSSPKPGVIMSSFQAKDQDIIDLVRPEPDLVQTKEPIFIPTSPGRILHLVLVCREVARRFQEYSSLHSWKLLESLIFIPQHKSLNAVSKPSSHWARIKCLLYFKVVM